MLPYLAKRDFVAVIKLRVLDEICLDYPGGPNVITGKEEAGVSFTEGNVMAEAEVTMRLLAEGHESRYVAASRAGKLGAHHIFLCVVFFFFIFKILY